MKLTHWLLIATVMPVSECALAVPGMWSSGFGQGITEYNITSQRKLTFTINCTINPDAENVLQNTVAITFPDGHQLRSSDDADPITLVTGGQQYVVPSSLGWLNGDNAWLSFISAVRQAGEFELWAGDKKVAEFQPGLKNAQAVLPEMKDCPVYLDN